MKQNTSPLRRIIPLSGMQTLTDDHSAADGTISSALNMQISEAHMQVAAAVTVPQTPTPPPLCLRQPLLYELHVTQRPLRVSASVPLTDTLARYDAAPATPVSGQQSLLNATLGTAWHDAPPTAATMLLAHALLATDQQQSLRGQQWMHHLRMARTALLLADGSHILWSAPFALMPASLKNEVHIDDIDQPQRALHYQSFLHAHEVWARWTDEHDTHDLRSQVQAIDIFVSQPLYAMQTSTPEEVITDAQGNALRLRFALADDATLAMRFERLQYSLALSLPVTDMTSPHAINLPAAGAPLADLSDAHAHALSARVTCLHEQRWCMADVTPVYHAPFLPLVHFSFHTLTPEQRADLSGDALAEALALEQLCDRRADIVDSPAPAPATLVAELTLYEQGALRSYLFSQPATYPLCMPLWVNDRRARALHLHISTTIDGIRRCWHRRAVLAPMTDGSDGAYALWRGQAAGHAEGTTALLSLLMQQCRQVGYDGATHTYTPRYSMWEVEDANTFDDLLTRAQAQHYGVDMPSTLCTGLTGSTLVFPQALWVTVGTGSIRALCTNTQRYSNLQIGTFPLLTFATDGVWALQADTQGRWRQRQLICRDVVEGQQQVTVAGQAVAYATESAIRLLTGTKVSTLAHTDSPLDPPLALPLLGEVMQALASRYGTTADAWLPAAIEQVHSMGRAHLFYDDHQQRLCALIEGTCFTCNVNTGEWGTAPVIDTPSPDTAMPALFITRPMKWGDAHRRKRPCHLHLCGRLPGAMSMALWWSDDLRSWHLAATSASHAMHHACASPHRFFVLLGAAMMLPGEYVSDVVVDFRQIHK